MFRPRRHRLTLALALSVTGLVAGCTTGSAPPTAPARSVAGCSEGNGGATPCSRPSQPPAGIGKAANLAAGSWSLLPAAPFEVGNDQTVVWAGRELVVWGGSHDANAPAAGAAYDPAVRRWHRLAQAPLSARTHASALWTGTEAFIWGGQGYAPQSGGVAQDRPDFDDGAAYDTAHDRWRRLAASPLSSRHGADAVWTGREVIVFGGSTGEQDATLTDGAAYDPRNNRWTRIPSFPVSSVGKPVSATVVWTGRALLGWATSEDDEILPGGGVTISPRNVVATWEPGAVGWRPLPQPPPGVNPYASTVTWTGREAVLVGGTVCLPNMRCPGVGMGGPGDTFDPSTGVWGTTPSSPVLGFHQPVVFTGDALVSIYDGSIKEGADISPGDGSALDSGGHSWSMLPRAPFTALAGAHLVWTGKELILWGGTAANGMGAAAALTPNVAGPGA